MDIFIIPIIRTLILLVGKTELTVHQTHKPRRGKNSVGGSYLLIYDGKSVSCTGSDLNSEQFRKKCSDNEINVIAELSDFDYKDLTSKLRKEFKEV